MVQKEKAPSRCLPITNCCKVEALISVDDRGQMVLPKEIRDKVKIQAGDKFAVTTWERDGEICCISLVKAEELADMVKGLLGPIMKDIIKGDAGDERR